MLKIKWNLLPPEFKYAVYNRDYEGTHYAVSEGRYCRIGDPSEPFYPEGWFRNLMPNEYEESNPVNGEWTSRAEWELEQWKQAPEWANFFITLPDGKSRWTAKEPSLKKEGWYNNGGVSDKAEGFIFQYGEDWQQSLRKRPEAAIKMEDEITALCGKSTGPAHCTGKVTGQCVCHKCEGSKENLKKEEIKDNFMICSKCNKKIKNGFEYKNNIYCDTCCPIICDHQGYITQEGIREIQVKEDIIKVHVINTTGLSGIEAWNKIKSEKQTLEIEGLKKRVAELERRLK